jgi:hypothetical protein
MQMVEVLTENRSKSQTGNLHVFMCADPGRRSDRRLVGPALVLPERCCRRPVGGINEQQLHLPTQGSVVLS